MIDYLEIKNSIKISYLLARYGFLVPDMADKFHILCPFHSERTASMWVDDSKGLFNCFGCGAGGTVIDLVARLEKISIKDAAKKLSEEYSISPVTQHTMSARKIRNQIETWKASRNREENAIEVPFELRDLPSGYRNIAKSTITHFGLHLTDSGVFIPHYDLSGTTVGYSIRQFEGMMPKYLNSTGFSKIVPYGLHQNKDNITDSGFCIVSEGQFDCIKLWDRGFKNSIAIMGSSMTDQQAYVLMSITTKLLLFFDGDKAGYQGAAKVLRRWNKCFQIKVVVLEPGYDPAEWLETLDGTTRLDSDSLETDT